MKKPSNFEGNGSSSSAGIAQRARHPDELMKDNENLMIDIDYYLAQQVSMAMAAKAKVLLRELKTVKADLAFAKERCAQLEEENKILRENGGEEGDRPEDDDLIRLQLESLLAEKARLAQENSVYARENRFLREIVEYHQLTMQDVVYIDDNREEVSEVYPINSLTTSTNLVTPSTPSEFFEFLCEDKTCLSKKFIVFTSEAEMKRHNAQEHGGHMSRSQRNAALQLLTSFTYQRSNEQDNGCGRRNTFLRDLSEAELSRAIEASLHTTNSNARYPEASSSIVSDHADTNGFDPLIQSFEALGTDADPPSRDLMAESHRPRTQEHTPGGICLPAALHGPSCLPAAPLEKYIPTRIICSL